VKPVLFFTSRRSTPSIIPQRVTAVFHGSTFRNSPFFVPSPMIDEMRVRSSFVLFSRRGTMVKSVKNSRFPR